MLCINRENKISKIEMLQVSISVWQQRGGDNLLQIKNIKLIKKKKYRDEKAFTRPIYFNGKNQILFLIETIDAD